MTGRVTWWTEGKCTVTCLASLYHTPTYLTSTTLSDRSLSNASSMTLTNSLTRSTPTVTALIISSVANAVPPALDRTQSSLCAFSVSVNDPSESVSSRCVGSNIGGNLKGWLALRPYPSTPFALAPLHNPSNSPLEIRKREAKRHMVDRQCDWRSLIRRMLQ